VIGPPVQGKQSVKSVAIMHCRRRRWSRCWSRRWSWSCAAGRGWAACWAAEWISKSGGHMRKRKNLSSRDAWPSWSFPDQTWRAFTRLASGLFLGGIFSNCIAPASENPASPI
jgi:hypothetical protein